MKPAQTGDGRRCDYLRGEESSTGALDTRQDESTDSFRFRKKIDGREKGQIIRDGRFADIPTHPCGRDQ